MGRLRKHEAEQITRVYYGINLKTYKVETAYLTRGGTLSVWRGDQRLSTVVGHGRTAESECIVVFDLSDIRAFPVSMEKSESEKRALEELREKAEAMRAAGD